MFLIDPIPYQNALAQAKAQLAEQKARIEQTRREENRLQELFVMESISQREYDNAVSDNAVANTSWSPFIQSTSWCPRKNGHYACY